MKKKADLPEKICPICNRPFKWRKKWERVWEEVKYCSERCRRNKKKSYSTNVVEIYVVKGNKTDREYFTSNEISIARDLSKNQKK